MFFARPCPFILAVALLAPTPAAAADYAWIEAESLTTPPHGFKIGGWGNMHYLSGGNWLFAAIDGKEAETLPAGGLDLSYPFMTKASGSHEVWARLGYEFVRTPLKWRIDDGPWGEDKPEHLTSDLMSLAEWTELAWVKLGTAELSPGKHTLHLKYERRVLPGKKQPERILAGLDCFCISKEAFRPNGRFKPDEDYRDDTDKKAAAHVFVATRDGPRTTLPLQGPWEIARFDEQEIHDRAQPVKELPALDTLFWKGVMVPGNRDTARPDMLYCHRFLYRTHVSVPAKSTQGAFVLRFPNTALIASVFVNGKYCAGNATPCAAWDADITEAVIPGKKNEIVIAIKGTLLRTGKNRRQQVDPFAVQLSDQLVLHGGWRRRRDPQRRLPGLAPGRGRGHPRDADTHDNRSGLCCRRLCNAVRHAEGNGARSNRA